VDHVDSQPKTDFLLDKWDVYDIIVSRQVPIGERHMNLREIFEYVRNNIESLRKFKDPDRKTILLVREEMANVGIEVTPDEVRDYMILLGAVIDKLDQQKDKD
jgi:hypothetical protein